MLVELGNHNPLPGAYDDQPKVTSIHIPEFDDGSTHDDALYEVAGKEVRLADLDNRALPEGAKLVKAGPRLGGYTHSPGLSAEEFTAHVQDAILNRDRIFRLPEHEALLAITQEGWRHHAAPQLRKAFIGGAPAPGTDDLRPRWVKVTPNHEFSKPKHAADIERFLREYYALPDSAVAPPEDELQARYHTVLGEPGVGFPKGPPDIKGLYLNAGRVQDNTNDGGGQVGSLGVGSAATGTSLTVAGTPGWATNQYAGYRIVVYSTTSNNMVWGNVTANGTGTNPSVTVDRWYNVSTPGGSAATTPTTPWAFMILDGGLVSAWFGGLTTTNITPAAGDTTLSGEYTTAGGGYLRKIAPYAQTSGVSPRSLTLIPVYTGNGSDTYPSTFFAVQWAASMVVPTPAVTPRYETSLNASATVGASGDQITLTETESGS